MAKARLITYDNTEDGKHYAEVFYFNSANSSHGTLQRIDLRNDASAVGLLECILRSIDQSKATGEALSLPPQSEHIKLAAIVDLDNIDAFLPRLQEAYGANHG